MLLARRAAFLLLPRRACTPQRELSQTNCMKRKQMVKIGTHSGTFHCDEALGVFMLRHTAQFEDAEVVRSRDPEVLKVRHMIGRLGVPGAAWLKSDLAKTDDSMHWACVPIVSDFCMGRKTKVSIHFFQSETAPHVQ